MWGKRGENAQWVCLNVSSLDIVKNWTWQSCVGHCACGCRRNGGECGGGLTFHWQLSNNFPPIQMDRVADRFLLCLNTFTSKIIRLWLTTIWNNTFTSEIWCLWLTHDPASRWLMASSVTTSRRIALLYFVLCTLLYFGLTLQSSCSVQAPKAVAGGTCSALLYIICTLLHVQSCRAVSAVEHQVEPVDKQTSSSKSRRGDSLCWRFIDCCFGCQKFWKRKILCNQLLLEINRSKV